MVADFDYSVNDDESEAAGEGPYSGQSGWGEGPSGGYANNGYGGNADDGQSRPTGRHRGPGHPDYSDYATAPGNDTPMPVTDGGPRPGYPPANSGPMNAYPQTNGRQIVAYPRPNGTSTIPGFPPANSGPNPAYRSGPNPAYRSGPNPAYQRPGGGPGGGAYQSGYMALEAAPAYPPANGQATAYQRSNGGQTTAYQGSNGWPGRGYPQQGGGQAAPRGYNGGRATAYEQRPNGQQSPGYPSPLKRITGAMPASAASVGKPVLGWLPFGQRLVLLPKPNDGPEEHRDINGGWLRPAVFGAMDGLVTNASLIAGIGGGGGAKGMIVLTGLAGLIAGAFSMATGEYISVKSQNELTLASVELERKLVLRDPVGKARKLAELYVEKKGVSPNLADAVVRQISADPERAIAAHVREELGIDPDDLPSPRIAAVASFMSFTVGALIPLAPFLLGVPSLKVALVLAAVSALAGGAAVARLTGRSMLMGGVRQFVAAFLGTGAAFLLGHLIGGHVG